MVQCSQMYSRVCRERVVAMTIADLAGEERVTAMRLAEALQYRASRQGGPSQDERMRANA